MKRHPLPYSSHHTGNPLYSAHFGFRRQMLSSVRSVIVDEIHALAATSGGAHLRFRWNAWHN